MGDGGKDQALLKELLERYGDAETLAEAERALAQLEQIDGGAWADEGSSLGDLYDELAEYAAEEDTTAAARLQARAVALGCEHPRLARTMLGWYLLADGQTVAGEAEFAALIRDDPDDPRVLIDLGLARQDTKAGDGLPAFDEALRVARRIGDAHLVFRAQVEREDLRDRRGLPPDDDDRAAFARQRELAGRSPFPSEVVPALGWFAPGERIEALRRWPDLRESEMLGDPVAYAHGLERQLRRLSRLGGRQPRIAPIEVDALLAFADERAYDAGAPHARAQFAAFLDEQGGSLPWPPGRNEPCWCGSGRKYKRCCAAA